MAPAQSLAVGEEEGKPKIVIKSEEANGDCKDKKEEGLGLFCENNCEDSGLFYGDSLAVRDKVDGDVFDQELDVVGCLDAEVVVVEPEKVEDPDATEHSSSFGNTFSGGRNDEARMSASDFEVDSQFSMVNGEQPVSDGFGRLFKKKKVTAHWRRYISPIMWRLQWLGLRINELCSQALLYDKELEEYKREKQLHSKMIELADSVSRSVPLPCQSHRKRAMKRRKRKRNEETVDMSSYMSNHNIFSYYENKRSETDGHSVDDAGDNQVDEILKGTDDHEWSVLGFKGGDNSLEQILLNIEALQSRVLSLKAQLSKVCRISRDISSTAGNFLQGDPPISFAQSHSCSPGNNGDAMPMYHGSEYEEEIVVPESAVSSYGDAADGYMIESTAGLLSAADVTRNHLHLGDSYKDSADDVLIDNKAVDEDLQNFEVVSHGREKHQELGKEEAQPCSEDESTAPTASVAEPGPGNQNADVQQQPALKPCYTGKKRGRKPKRKWRGGCVAGWKNERFQKRKLN